MADETNKKEVSGLELLRQPVTPRSWVTTRVRSHTYTVCGLYVRLLD